MQNQGLELFQFLGCLDDSPKTSDWEKSDAGGDTW